MNKSGTPALGCRGAGGQARTNNDIVIIFVYLVNSDHFE
jgi:hypothetical protein